MPVWPRAWFWLSMISQFAVAGEKAHPRCAPGENSVI